jgi:glycine/D-amino acid oxidase-like deaminating enzyme
MCAGFSGHGFKLGPAIGELMAEEIVDGEAGSVDIRRFNLSRFSRGELFKAAYGANRA